MKRPKVKSPGRADLRALVDAAGGPERVLALLTQFYTRMSEDVLIGFFFTGHDLSKIIQGQWQFILMAAGLIERFEGKGPSTAHTALPPILSGHFDRRLVILRETLAHAGLDKSLIAGWVSFEESFRAMIVSN